MIPIPPIVYTVLIASSIGFYSGYQVKDTIALAEKASILKAERVKLLKAKKVTSDILSQLQESKKSIKIVYKTIVKKVPSYVTVIQKTDSSCNITLGAKRMLNDSINSMSSTPRTSPEANTKTSPIREVDLVMYLAKAIKEYNLAKTQCNSLINWYNKTKE